MILLENQLLSRFYKFIESDKHNQSQEVNNLLNDPEIQFEEITSCPICQHQHFSLLSEKTVEKINIRTVICKNCSQIFAYDQMTSHSMSYFYKKYYRSIICPAKKNSKRLHLKFKQKGNYRIPNYVPKKGLICEIGCGAGWHLYPFKKVRRDYIGFDFDEDLIQFGRNNYDLNIHIGDINEIKKRQLTPSYIFMNHVLEHTKYPLDILKDIFTLLCENGVLNISVPSRQYLIWGGGGTGYRFFDTLTIVHPFIFDEYTLSNCLKLAGFTILHNQGGNILAKKISSQKRPLTFISNTYLNVIDHLKFVEKITLSPVYAIYKKLPAFLSHNMYYLYFFTNPYRLLKKIFLIYF